MSNPTVSFRLSSYQLARGLRAVRAIESNWQLTTASDLVRTIFNDYIAKSEHLYNSPLDISPDLLHEIENVRIASTVANARVIANARAKKMQANMPLLGQTNQLADTRTPQQIMLDNQAAQMIAEQTPPPIEQADIDEQIALALTQQSTKPPVSTGQLDPSKPKVNHKAPEEYEDTGSTITTVADFSPPEDWKE